MPGFSAINRVLGWVVLAGQFTAINVVLPWVFLPLFMFSDILVVRVIAGVLSGLVLWSAYRLVANGVRMVARHRVLDLRPFVWAAALVLMLVISALVAVEV
jgi:hypothetical protein